MTKNFRLIIPFPSRVTHLGGRVAGGYDVWLLQRVVVYNFKTIPRDRRILEDDSKSAAGDW